MQIKLQNADTTRTARVVLEHVDAEGRPVAPEAKTDVGVLAPGGELSVYVHRGLRLVVTEAT